ncbi:MAG: hypothetical protein OXE86_20520 [Alphaproteobacteria bacterium]|nr:hypothetical protein [Alphaproteobacteria bacterium]
MTARTIAALSVFALLSPAPCHAAFWWEGLGPFVKPGVVVVPSPCQRGCADGRARTPGAGGTEPSSRRQLEQDIERNIEREIERVIRQAAP